MDSDISDDTLPDVSIKISDKECSFEMPDASALAAERKLVLSQQIEIQEFQIAAFNSCGESSNGTDNDSDTEVSNCIRVLQLEVPKITIPIENPGINMRELDLAEVVSNLDETRALFIKEIIDNVTTGQSKKYFTKLLLDSITSVLSESLSTFTSEDIQCQLLALSLLILDRECRMKVDVVRAIRTMQYMLDHMPETLKSEKLLNDISTHFCKIYKNIQDRFHLAECFVSIKVDPIEMSTLKYFSNSMARSLAVKNLAEIIGLVNFDAKLASSDMATFKRTVTSGSRWSVISPFEQFIAISLMNLLLGFIPLEMDDEIPKNELLHFISGLKCNSGKGNSGDFIKVKALAKKTNLLWHTPAMDSKRLWNDKTE